MNCSALPTGNGRAKQAGERHRGKEGAQEEAGRKETREETPAMELQAGGLTSSVPPLSPLRTQLTQGIHPSSPSSS